ncbi:MAG: hypothetical protein OXC07_08755 [Kistimonas sp.]|nr:hypothetical protein [Kistimonas sp.]
MHSWPLGHPRLAGGSRASLNSTHGSLVPPRLTGGWQLLCSTAFMVALALNGIYGNLVVPPCPGLATRVPIGIHGNRILSARGWPGIVPADTPTGPHAPPEYQAQP